MAQRWKCEECNEIIANNDLRTIFVDHPKSRHDNWLDKIQLTQCPECGACEHFRELCDEPGCDAAASCGWPASTGYRRTCSAHAK